MLFLFTAGPAFLIVIVLLMVCLFRANYNDVRWDYLLTASALTMPASMASVMFVHWISQFIPYKYDQYVFAFDAHFGLPSFAIGQFVMPHPWMVSFLACVYSLLPGGFLVLYATYLFGASIEQAQAVLRCFLILFFLTPLLFFVFPASGPLYAFHSFPYNPPAHLLPHLVALGAAPNAVPSGHAAAALLMVYFSRPWRWGTLLSIVFLALTVLATLGSGEHYLFDLFMAVPYTALIIYVSGANAICAEAQTDARSWPHSRINSTKSPAEPAPWCSPNGSPSASVQ